MKEITWIDITRDRIDIRRETVLSKRIRTYEVSSITPSSLQRLLSVLFDMSVHGKIVITPYDKNGEYSLDGYTAWCDPKLRKSHV